MIGTFAALAALMEEMVCSLTPSSAATTRTTMSVTLAPRERISLNAAWPGVSMNVITCPSGAEMEEAPMCCVMPPASPAATSDERSASSSDVLPWSTWPITVTTGGRRSKSAEASSSSKTPHASSARSRCSASSSPARDTSAPTPSAIAAAVSPSMDCVMEASTPRFIKSLTTSATPMLHAAARSPTVIESPMVTLAGPVGSGGGTPLRLFLRFPFILVRVVASSSMSTLELARRSLPPFRAEMPSRVVSFSGMPFLPTSRFGPSLRRRAISRPSAVDMSGTKSSSLDESLESIESVSGRAALGAGAGGLPANGVLGGGRDCGEEEGARD
mmetsp:Transcript_1719/g.3607  ORF Transcript_1719/g.3607 Transcript_1719/m.3607 type:complete len:330 (-) Transcript_1719:308-1297(-)